MPTRKRSSNLSVGEVLDRVMNDSDSNDEFEMSETELDDPGDVDSGVSHSSTPVPVDTPDLQVRQHSILYGAARCMLTADICTKMCPNMVNTFEEHPHCINHNK